MALLEVIDVTKTWLASRGKEITALQDISFQVEQEEFVCVIGASGCGKSTLLHLIAGLESPSAGRIVVEGTHVVRPSWERGLVFQEHTLFPWRTVSGNIKFGLEARGIPREERALIADRYIRLVGLQGFEDLYPMELSGGMRQRVALARVLANDPKILLLDEPFGSLDAQTRNIMQKELLVIWERVRKTVVFVTHDIIEAAYLADRVLVLGSRPGRVRFQVQVELPRPRDRLGTGFLETCQLLEGLLKEETELGFCKEVLT